MTRVDRWTPGLLRCARGAMALEYVLATPLFLSITATVFEFSYDAYLRTQIEGIISQGARDITLESASSADARAELDAQIGDEIRQLAPQAVVNFQLESFRSYARARDPAEPFIDANNNGRCDHGESYEDTNGDGSYSLNSAINGLGGADDVAVYTITVSYQRLLGAFGIMGLQPQGQLSATRMFRIQPYSATQAVVVRTCP